MTNKERFVSLCNDIDRDGVYELMEWLEKSDFYSAPASTRFHGNYAGGLLEHSLNVYDELKRLLEIYGDSVSVSESTIRKMVSDAVLNAAFRRDTYNKLVECQRLCFNSAENEIEQQIYSTLDDVMMEYSTATEVPQYKDVVDGLWEEIKARQANGMSGIPFKFPTLNQYVSIEPGELVVFAAEAKQGKSMMLLNCAVDLLKKGKKVLYIDSELNSRLFTCRLLAHLAKIEFSRVKSGHYSPEEEERINKCLEWLKKKSFTHLYMPIGTT